MTTGFRLHSERIMAPDATPARWLLVLHGVFGSGANWRLFMRALSREVPACGFVLVDLRGHAGSAFGAPPPHDIASAARDLLAFEGIDGVVGHSLGGKVALAYAALRADALDQVWVLDTQPGARATRDGPTDKVLSLLASLPETFDDRAAFVRAVEAGGQPRAIAQWLAMNLRREGEVYRLQLDLTAIGDLLTDHFRQDLWPEIERPDRRRALHLVVGRRSFVWQPGDDARLQRVAGPRVHVHTLDAGHWVHTDAPDALQALMRDAFSRWAAPG